MPSAGGGVVVASGGGGVSDGVGLGAGSAGIGAGVVGAVSAGGVFMSALSSFLAQPAANTIAVTASKAKARMSLPSSVSDELGVPY